MIVNRRWPAVPVGVSRFKIFVLSAIFLPGFSSRDDWIRTALDCIELMPKGEKIVNAYLCESNEIVQKLKLYQGVIAHYTSASEPIIPNGFADVMVAIFNLIMQVRAAQLWKHSCLPYDNLPVLCREIFPFARYKFSSVIIFMIIILIIKIIIKS